MAGALNVQASRFSLRKGGERSTKIDDSGPDARVAELADAPDLGSGTVRCGGSSPSVRTTLVNAAIIGFQSLQGL